MNILKRCKDNPLIVPQEGMPWMEVGAFNPSVVKTTEGYVMAFRALTKEVERNGHKLQLSTIGVAQSRDGVKFETSRQLFVPEYEWEEFGCEDPRIGKIDDEYAIFYTGLGHFPPAPADIKIGVALTKDFKTVSQRKLVTPFNSKAMTLFPRRIKDRLMAVLTVHTDLPPAKIAVASFYSKEELWNPEFWRSWYLNLDEHVIPLQRMKHDHIEVGAAPLELPEGWLLIYCYIQDYSLSEKRQFRIEAVLLDLDDPRIVIGRLEDPLLVPEVEYELEGVVNDVIFPSGALIEDGELKIYYGAADTYSCLASVKVDHLLARMRQHRHGIPKLRRLGGPILTADSHHFWEAKAVLNPAAVYEDGLVHLLYRAIAPDNTSVLGYAISQDGYSIDLRENDPVFLPKHEAELKKSPNANSGVEDPRLTKLDDRFYMTYTAYDGVNRPRVALTSIAVKDFLDNNWEWTPTKIISSAEKDNKNACLLPEKIGGRFVMFHRQTNNIHLDYLDNLEFENGQTLEGHYEIPVRPESWDAVKIGISAPPIKTEHGWLLLYHGISQRHHEYRVGAMLLDLKDPAKVLARTPYALLEPQAEYEIHGDVPNVVFPCGAVDINGTLFVYYGAADSVVAVASITLEHLYGYLEELHHPRFFGRKGNELE